MSVAERWQAYWHDFETERGRVVALRFLLFGLLAFDLWGVTLEHASRYGAGGFNVAQIGLLDTLLGVPTPAIIAAGWLVGGYFCLRAAFGIATRVSIIGATVCYFGIYLWSQADSYQHHYLVGLLLTLSCFIPESVWAATPPDRDAVENDPAAWARWHRVRHWGLRLIYVQIALMYFWTGVTKADPTWLSGATMDALTTTPSVRAGIAGFEESMGLARGEGYAWAATAVMVGELLAPLAFLFRRLWLPGLLIIPWFHVGVEILEFDIELFSYYMIGLDVILLTPDGIWRRARGWVHARRQRLREGRMGPRRWLTARPEAGGPRMVIALVTAAVCGYGASTIPVEGSDMLGGLIGGFTLLALWPAPRIAPRFPVYSAVMQVLIVLTMSGSVMYFESLYDMYRLWGGDLRRRGDLEGAAEKYAIANAAMPGKPARRYQQAQLYERLERFDEAVPLYEASMQVHRDAVERLTTATHRDPTDAALFFELGEDQLRLADRCQALVRVRQRTGGDVEEMHTCRRTALLGARESADKGLALEPRNRDGFKLRRQIQRETRGR